MTARCESVTPKELAVLEALWNEPDIDYHRIVLLSERYHNAVSPNRIHKLLRSLLEKGLIFVSGEENTVSTRIKKYRSSIMREEYLANLLEISPAYDEVYLPRLFACLCDRIQKPETREELLEIVRTEKERR